MFLPNLPIAILELPNCLSHRWLTFPKRCYWFVGQQYNKHVTTTIFLHQKNTQIMTYIIILMSVQTIYSIKYCTVKIVVILVFSYQSVHMKPSLRTGHFINLPYGKHPGGHSFLQLCSAIHILTFSINCGTLIQPCSLILSSK